MEIGYITQFTDVLLLRRGVHELPRFTGWQAVGFSAFCAMITALMIANPWMYPRVFIGLCLYMALDAVPHYVFLMQRGLPSHFNQLWVAIQTIGTFFRMCFVVVGLLLMHRPVFLVLAYLALAVKAVQVFVHMYSTGFSVVKIHAVGYFALITACLWVEILGLMLVLSTMLGGLSALNASVLAIGH